MVVYSIQEDNPVGGLAPIPDLFVGDEELSPEEFEAYLARLNAVGYTLVKVTPNPIEGISELVDEITGVR